MFVRQVRVKGYGYLQIVESYRVKGKHTPRHRMLCSLGRADDRRLQEVRCLLRDWQPMTYAPAFLAEIQDTTQPQPQGKQPPFHWRH